MACLSCTCETGVCRRTGHVPQPADCGHPGVAGFTPSGLTYCHRAACRDRAGIASAIIALTRRPDPADDLLRFEDTEAAVLASYDNESD